MKTIIAEEMKTQRENVKRASKQAKHAGGTLKKRATKTPNSANRDDASWQKTEKKNKSKIVLVV